MKKILYAIPGTEMDAEEIERRRKVLNSFCGKEFTVDVRICRTGPPAIESYYDEFMSVPDTLRIIVQAEKQDYDSVIIGCFGDPGIDAARELVDIPIVGPGESSMLLACSLGDEFSILSILESVKKQLKKYAQKVGVGNRLASVRVIGVPVTEIGKKTKEVKQSLLGEAKKAISVDGADVLILGCMSEGFLGIAEEMMQELRIPVINPVSVAVKTAELFVSCGLTHSRLAYLNPPSLRSIKMNNTLLKEYV